MTNPYEAPNSVDAVPRGSRWVLAWNALLCLMAVGLFVIAAHVFTVHRTDLSLYGDTKAFPSGVSNDWWLLAMVGFFLIELSTAPLHRRPALTRFVAIVVCVLVAFHFPSIRFDDQILIRGLIAAALFLPLIVFGSGLPHACSQLMSWLKNDLQRPGAKSQDRG